VRPYPGGFRISQNPMNSAFRLVVLALFLAMSAALMAQQPVNSAPTITFSLDFPQSIPDHYVITVSSDRRASYESTGKLTPQADPGEPFGEEFTMSADTCKKIFELGAKAKYFEGQIDSGNKKLASTGVKVLTYVDGARKTEATYNYSPNPAVQQVTAIFQNISSTLEFGRRLEFYHHHQKLALEEELKRMEEMARSKSLEEIQALAPVLQSIVADRSVLNVTRARAQRLLNGANVAAASAM
jgi:hypothetical protein